MTQEEILAQPGTKASKILKLKELGFANKAIAALVGTNQGNVWNVVNKAKGKAENAPQA